MSRMGRIMVIATSSLAFFACQGCVGTMTGQPAADMPLPVAANTAVVSEGIRMATDGAFEGDITAASPVRAVSDTYFTINEAPGPQLAASVSFVADTTEIAPWATDAFSIKDTKTLLTDIEWSGNEAVQTFQGSMSAARLIRPVVEDKNFAAEFAFGAPREETGLAFDLNLVPSVSYQEEGEFETRRVGAEIRLGRDFDQRGTQAVADSWYVFAGTEGEALVWEAGEYGFSNVTGAMALRDQVTVGDMQAGVSIQRGRGQLSLSYIRREVEWRDRNGGASTNEDFAGISFTLKQ
ncbi:MAG: hypothetical protein AAFR33_04870 [Pseudomonadota bacterium]